MIDLPAKIKLLVVVPTLECGGLERNVSILCNHINTEKFDVTLAVINNADPFFTINNPAIKVLDLKTINVRKSLPAILQLSRKLKPHIILTTANHLNLLFAIFKRLFPTRIKIIARESSIVSINTQYSWNPRLFNWMLRKFYRRLDMIVCQSRYMQDDLVKNYGVPVNRTQIIYNAVNPPVVAGTNDPGTVNLLAVARLSPEKGLDRLLKAVSLLNIKYTFTIVGEGNMRTALEQLIREHMLQEKVLLPGSSAEPFATGARPDLFLMGSHYEGFPNALLEALSAGIPVVAFDAPGGIGELLQDRENGILVKENSEQAFATAIKEALEFPFNRERIQEKTRGRFNAKAIAANWEDLFKSMLTHSK